MYPTPSEPWALYFIVHTVYLFIGNRGAWSTWIDGRVSYLNLDTRRKKREEEEEAEEAIEEREEKTKNVVDS